MFLNSKRSFRNHDKKVALANCQIWWWDASVADLVERSNLNHINCRAFLRSFPWPLSQSSNKSIDLWCKRHPQRTESQYWSQCDGIPVMNFVKFASWNEGDEIRQINLPNPFETQRTPDLACCSPSWSKYTDCRRTRSPKNTCKSFEIVGDILNGKTEYISKAH